MSIQYAYDCSIFIISNRISLWKSWEVKITKGQILGGQGSFNQLLYNQQ